MWSHYTPIGIYTQEITNEDMKIWYGITTAKYLKYRSVYIKLREHLINSGHILTHDWFLQVDPDFHRKDTNKRDSRDMKKIYDEIIRAIDNAEAVIIEFTVPNFSTAHQINYALFKRKPTLVLRMKKDNPYFTDSYIEAIDSEYLKVVEYDLKNYKEVIDQFIGESSIGFGIKRYNVVLGSKHDYYLDWLANKEKITRSEALRRIIDHNSNSNSTFSKHIKGAINKPGRGSH